MLSRSIAFLLLAAFIGFSPAALAQRVAPPVPDLTADGQPDDKHDWNLGPTGARGWIWGWNRETSSARQIQVTAVAPDSPADGVLEVGDVILGIDKASFDRDARHAFGDAITAAESPEGRGRLRLLRWRAGETKTVTLRLPVLGSYTETAPWDCAKSDVILDRACEHIAGHMKGDIDGMINALALLATGKSEYRPAIRELAHKVGRPDTDLTLLGRTSGLFAWEWGYRNLFLCEYYLATRDKFVMPAILEYSQTMAEGQSGVGTWGHGMAWPDLNGGQLHGKLGGYGALNQSGLICHLSLVLAKKCGMGSDEVDMAIEKANRFAAFYSGKGAIPYGDHRPGWHAHDDNGKNSVAALIFDLQGLKEEARFFSKMTVASYAERERGHTGNYFSYLWGPLGAARTGPAATAAFMKEQRGFFDMARTHTADFVYQGGAGMSGGEHKYGDWDCTGSFVLAHTLPLGKLYITGRGRSTDNDLTSAEVAEAIAAGRGFDCWNQGADYYGAMETDVLVGHLESWSPAVRTRASAALGKRTDAPVEALVQLLGDDRLEARYGACQALGELKERAASAVPALTEALESDDVWLRIQACFALAGIGDPARSAVPEMLRLALTEDAQDPRGYTQRFLAFTLFYKGGALGFRGLLAKSLDGVDREALLPVIARLIKNDDGRARGAVESAYRNLTFEELQPLMPEILESIRVPSPSGVMFSSGIRFAGVEWLARNHVKEGMDLALQITEINEWGKGNRVKLALKSLRHYGASASAALPAIHDLKRRLSAQGKPGSQVKLVTLCDEAIASIEASDSAPELISLKELAGSKSASAKPTLKVFILAGQSNMVGAGRVAAEPQRNGGKGSLEHLVKDHADAANYTHLIDANGAWVQRDDVWISYFEREGALSVGFGEDTETIGPELGFGHAVGMHFDEPVLLVKVAWGGKSIGMDFRPPSAGGEVGESYKALFAQVREVLGSIDQRFPDIVHGGYEVMGIAWHQGWNDRVNQEFNDAYEHNLSCFIRDARKELGIPGLPFVLAETGMSGPNETHPRALSLMAAQAAVAASEEFKDSVGFVGTRDLFRAKDLSPSGQAYHWNSNAETYYLIGDGLGQSMIQLLGALDSAGQDSK